MNPVLAAKALDSKAGMIVASAGVFLVSGVVIYTFIQFNKAKNETLEALGLKDDEYDKFVKDNEAKTTSYFTPNYYKGILKTLKSNERLTIINLPTGQTMSKTILDAKGYVYDTPESVHGTLRKCQSKLDVSRLSEIFYDTYKKDLYGYLQTFLDAEEMATVIAIVKQLKDKIIVKQ